MIIIRPFAYLTYYKRMIVMQLQIGNIIARARRARELTQENLADMLGVSAAAVSKWETGERHEKRMCADALRGLR